MKDFDTRGPRQAAIGIDGAQRVLMRPERFSIKLARDTGIIHSEVLGYWTVEDAVAYVDAMKTFVLASRLTHGRACLLVDRTGSQVQSLQVSELLGGLNAFLEENDRLAMIVSSALSKMQLDRITVHTNTMAFTSPADALAFLGSDRRGGVSTRGER